MNSNPMRDDTLFLDAMHPKRPENPYTLSCQRSKYSILIHFNSNLCVLGFNVFETKSCRVFSVYFMRLSLTESGDHFHYLITIFISKNSFTEN